MMSSAFLVQTQGSQRLFQPTMSVWIAVISSLTEAKVPQWIAWRVMIPKEISTRPSQEPEVPTTTPDASPPWGWVTGHQWEAQYDQNHPNRDQQAA